MKCVWHAPHFFLFPPLPCSTQHYSEQLAPLSRARRGGFEEMRCIADVPTELTRLHLFAVFRVLPCMNCAATEVRCCSSHTSSGLYCCLELNRNVDLLPWPGSILPYNPLELVCWEGHSSEPKQCLQMHCLHSTVELKELTSGLETPNRWRGSPLPASAV